MAERSEDEKKFGATSAAFQEAVARLGADAAHVEQLDGVPLFPLDKRPDDGGEGELESGEGAGRKRGRPPGARNRSTSVNRQYILGTFGDPLAMLARRNMTDLPALLKLAEQLNCRPIELFNAQNAALAKMLPYVHSPQPAAVKIEGQGAIAFAFGVVVDEAGDELAEGTDYAAIEDMARRISQDREQNQGVKIIDVEASNVESSNVEPEKRGGSDG